jgi:hypothetical protein
MSTYYQARLAPCRQSRGQLGSLQAGSGADLRPAAPRLKRPLAPNCLPAQQCVGVSAQRGSGGLDSRLGWRGGRRAISSGLWPATTDGCGRRRPALPGVLEHRDLSVPDAAYPAAEKGFPSSRPRLKESTLRLKEGPPYGTPSHHRDSHPPLRRRVQPVPSLRATIPGCYRRGS